MLIHRNKILFILITGCFQKQPFLFLTHWLGISNSPKLGPCQKRILNRHKKYKTAYFLKKIDMKSVVFLVETNFEETNYREETVFSLKNDTKKAFRHKVDIKSTQARILILLVLREICVDMSILNL